MTDEAKKIHPAEGADAPAERADTGSRPTAPVAEQDAEAPKGESPLPEEEKEKEEKEEGPEIPGVPAASVQIRVLGNRIEVTGEKPPDFPAGETSFLCLERIFGKFQRAFEVRGSVNLGEVSARMANGILVITIPKVVERRGRERRIPVTIG